MEGHAAEAESTHDGIRDATGLESGLKPGPGLENVLGVGVSRVDLARAVASIHGWITRKESHYVCVTSVHGVMESQGSDELRRIHNSAGMVTPDGMPLAWLLRLAGCEGTGRVCGPDLMEAVFSASVPLGHRHFLYGATPATLDRLAAGLQARAPGAQIVGRHAPPFRRVGEAEDPAVIDAINAARPDIVWVGLSTPKQEFWMARHRPLLRAPVLIGVGAAFDVHAGHTPRAPLLMQRSGLEWLYRTAREPRRLWWRYFSNNPRFVALIALQKAGLYVRPVP